ncbi:ubiquinol-cytochrome C chaperone [Rhodovastum atsumiense]|uniref:Ubiquinol-cytochrome C chaperone n=2 Tax=Rhodovastum atsumiense TaxID=504468 RepID=A0A5M6IJZ1_9PROT|nr:ubiquinol-cytochrome C chaperone [Rhodovastum atsumiense]
MGVFGFFRRNRYEQLGYELYGAAVAAARDPWLYASLGVPDTLDGRFDLVGLHTFLVIRRLQRDPAPGPALAQAVFDAMFTDMDVNLREMGVGDLSVGKKVKIMWEAFHGRAQAYGRALDQEDEAELAAALARNVWRGQPDAGGAARLAVLARAQDRHLAGQDLTGGRVAFLPAAEAAGAAPA